MYKNFMLLAILEIALILTGCMENSKSKKCLDVGPVIVAPYTSTPIVVDGKLDDDIWKKATSYDLYFSADKINAFPTEPGRIKIAWDENYLYLACEFTDSDIIAEGDKNQMHHYKFGDLCELFLKPADKTWYWELYVTPKGNKTTFFFPSKGYLGLSSCFENYISDLQVAAQVDGSINDWSDKDNKWTGEMAMPVKDLTARGEGFGPISDWRILIGRYNYSYYLPEKELSMFPQLSKTSYHLTNEYAKLVLRK